MGFYCQIYIASRVNSVTGKPVIPDITVPEEYRRFVDEKGPWYRAYMREDVWYDTVESVYEEFPSWEKVQEMFPNETKCEYGWSKKDHDLFKKAMQWFATQEYPTRFIIEWG